MRTCRVTQGETRSLTNAGTVRDRRAARGASVTLLLIAALVGCAERPPARLTGAFGDTLLVNSPDPTRLSARAEDAEGRGARVRDAYWQAVGEVPFSLSADGTVHCTRAGDGTVDVSRGASRSRLTVRCRPVTGMRVLVAEPLVLGGAPAVLGFAGVGPDGATVTQIAGRAGVRDTTIVALRDTLLVPRKRGVTSLLVSLAHCEIEQPLEVIERVTDPSALEASQVYEDTLSLVPEELRSWTLRPNLYTVEVEADSIANASLDLVAPGFSCAPLTHVARGLSCLSREPARMVLRHTGASPAPQRAVVRLRMSRAVHPDSSDARLRLAARGAARAGRGRLPSCPISF